MNQVKTWKIDIRCKTDLTRTRLETELQMILEDNECKNIDIEIKEAEPENHDAITVYIIPEWLAKEKKLPGTRIVGTETRRTDKAILFRLKGGRDEVWLPLSQITEETVPDDQVTFGVKV